MRQHDRNDSSPGDQAELVLRGGTVLVMDGAASRAEAVAVRRGRITAVGTSEEISRAIGAGTRVVELEGRAVLPGINDSHLHGVHAGATWPSVFFNGGAEAERVGSCRLAGPREVRGALVEAGERLLELGVTSYTEPGIGPGEDDGPTGCFGSDALDVYRALERDGELRQRVTVLSLFGLLDGRSSLEDFRRGIAEMRSPLPGADPHWLRVGGVKIFGDLVPIMRGSWTSHPYDDGSRGDLLIDGSGLADRAEALREMVRIAHRHGLQAGVHATGELTIQAVIDAVREVSAEPGVPAAAELAHYLIHGDLVTPTQLAELAELGMRLNMQPGIAVATHGMVAEVLGAAVADAAWPIGEALDRGVLALSSDAPMLAPDWRRVIADAEAWMRARGAGPDGAEGRLHLLLRACTAEGAVQDRAIGWKGTVERGKVADLVVLGADPFALGAAGMPDVPVDLTVLDGRVVFERGSGVQAEAPWTPRPAGTAPTS